nr:J domain-containing protein [Halomarina oriensis]
MVAALAATFAGLAVLLTLVAVVAEPVALFVAAPFAVVAYLLWYQASGRLVERVYASVEQRARVDERTRQRRTARGRAEADGGRGGFGAGPRRTGQTRRETAGGRQARERQAGGRRAGGGRRQRGRQRRAPRTDTGPSTAEAYSILDLDPSADQSAVRSAYRERVKETHPDRGGNEEEFKRVTAAYERLSE